MLTDAQEQLAADIRQMTHGRKESMETVANHDEMNKFDGKAAEAEQAHLDAEVGALVMRNVRENQMRNISQLIETTAKEHKAGSMTGSPRYRVSEVDGPNQSDFSSKLQSFRSKHKSPSRSTSRSASTSPKTSLAELHPTERKEFEAGWHFASGVAQPAPHFAAGVRAAQTRQLRPASAEMTSNNSLEGSVHRSTRKHMGKDDEVI